MARSPNLRGDHIAHAFKRTSVSTTEMMMEPIRPTPFEKKKNMRPTFAQGRCINAAQGEGLRWPDPSRPLPRIRFL
jgi:hypothetical protein